MSGEDGYISSDDLYKVETIVRQYCVEKFKRSGINPNHVHVSLSRNMNAVSKFIGGSPVKLILLWPHASDNINSLLKDFCNSFRKHRLYRPMEVMPFSIIREGKKLIKESFTDESEIIADLLPKSRIEVTKTETLKFRDTKTGESVSVTVENKPGRFNGDNLDVWFKLSRIVRDKFPQEPDDLAIETGDTNVR